MRFRNISRYPTYISHGGTIQPLMSTKDIPDLKNLLKSALANTSFDIVLDNEEVKLINQILERNEKSKSRDTSAIKKELKRDVVAETRSLKEKAEHDSWVKRINENRKRAKFFEDRTPETTEHRVEPKKLEGKPKSLSEILNHNATLG